jgi:hypothetical protein
VSQASRATSSAVNGIAAISATLRRLSCTSRNPGLGGAEGDLIEGVAIAEVLDRALVEIDLQEGGQVLSASIRPRWR